VGLCVVGFGLLGCSSNSGDDVVDSGPGPGPIFDGAVPVDSSTACNPVSGTGCEAGDKCTWIVDQVEPTLLAYTGCATNGAVVNGGTCVSPELGFDDCVALNYCLNEVCTEICSGDSCGVGFVCSNYSLLFEDVENVGLCNPVCDPVEQDCVADTEGCYLQATTGEASCAGIPTGAAEMTQDVLCYGPPSGGCYLNGCAEGFGANQPDDTCAFFCNPIDNWKDNVQGLTGDSTGITCASSFGEDRPAGPGPTFQCRYLQSFYSNTDLVAATTGLCVLPAKAPTVDWGAYGSCADFDWAQLKLDVADESASQTGYCDGCPQCCMTECISLATWDEAFPEKSGKSNYACFSEKKEIREQYCGLE
jgi:hypothetical protein